MDDVASKGYNSAVVEVGEDKAYVVRVTRLAPRQQLSLEEVSEDITAVLKREAAEEKAREAAQEALVALQGEANSTEVAHRWGLSWVRQEQANRREEAIPQPILDVAFKLPHPVENGRSLGLAELSPSAGEASQQFAVVAVTQVRDGGWESLSEAERKGIENQLQRRAASLDYGALFESLRRRADIKRAL